MKINKYNNLGKGWHSDSIRHHNAKVYGVAGGLYDSQLYLDSEMGNVSKTKDQKHAFKIYNKEYKNQPIGMFTYPKLYPKKTFINSKGLKDLDYDNPKNIQAISNVIGHEETHQVLSKEFDLDTSMRLDKISVGGVRSKNGKNIKNWKTTASINPKLAKKMDKKFKPIRKKVGYKY